MDVLMSAFATIPTTRSLCWSSNNPPVQDLAIRLKVSVNPLHKVFCLRGQSAFLALRLKVVLWKLGHYILKRLATKRTCPEDWNRGHVVAHQQCPSILGTLR
eukprot:4782635-Karenia_brevis.AAC.1